MPKLSSEGNSNEGGVISGEPITRVTAASTVARSTVFVNPAAGCTPATILLSEKSLKLILN